jgi:cytoskeletal protein RodZ
MYFKPRNTYKPLWELTAWYHELWPMQRGMFWVFVVMPMMLLLGVIVFKEPRMPQTEAKNDIIADVRSDRYETYEPNPHELALRAQEGRQFAPPKRYQPYVDRTENQTNRHRRLKHKYTNKNKDKHDVKQSGSTR